MSPIRPTAPRCLDGRLVSPLFAYGTLCFSGLVRRVLGHEPPHQDAVLHDFACYSLRRHGYPGITPESGARVMGRLYHGLSVKDWHKLAAYEDDFYRCWPLTVQGARGGPQQAQAFVVPASQRAILGDKPWHARQFARYHLRCFLQTLSPGGAARVPSGTMAI